MKFKGGSKVSGCFLAMLLSAVATAQPAFVAGPVDSICPETGTLTVLGQTHVIETETLLIANGKRVSRATFERLLQPGSLVVVDSLSDGDHSPTTSITLSSDQYVPGASPVFVVGTVEKVDGGLGQIRIGGLTLDITGATPEIFAAIKVGSFVEISGTQPLSKGVLLASGISISPSALSIGGTGRATSSLSIGGTGIEASGLSIGGTGAGVSSLSIGGTGVEAARLSIGGTGRETASLSIGGTGIEESTLSIGGTGVKASTLSIGGTGREASSLSIGGTGKAASTSSIGGTGNHVSTLSIGGTGAASF